MEGKKDTAIWDCLHAVKNVLQMLHTEILIDGMSEPLRGVGGAKFKFL